MINLNQYKKKYKESTENPEKFWGEIAEKNILWNKKPTNKISGEYPDIEWFKGGKLNITESCLDKHIKNGDGKKVAYTEIDENDNEKKITYKDLLSQVNKLSNALNLWGIKKGDIILIYMPTVIEQIVSMLACARIGAIHSVVFAGLSAKVLNERILDTKAKIIITADGFERRGKYYSTIDTVRESIKGIKNAPKTLILNRFNKDTILQKNEVDYKKFTENQSINFKPVYVEANHPLFILYTSGSTGKPKGIVHSTGGYGVYASFTMQSSFDLKKNDIFWCTADAGWITGHSYVAYAPLINDITSLLVAGAPDYPKQERWWSILESHKVTTFYTSPTAIRLLREHGNKILNNYKFKNLRIIGSVGEPLNPSVSKWFEKYVGKNRATLVDTWWQTETGGHMIATLPGLKRKLGKAGLPFFGTKPEIINANGEQEKNNKSGLLIIKGLWPGMLANCLNQKERFNNYFNKEKKYYITGDVGIKDKDNYFQILGRADDVMNVSGHRVGSAEIENAVLLHKDIIEVAAVGVPHKIKGECIKVFCVVKNNQKQEELQIEIKTLIKEQIGSFATPDYFEFIDKLPKTRSGKIMRRLLRTSGTEKINQDMSTLES